MVYTDSMNLGAAAAEVVSDHLPGCTSKLPHSADGAACVMAAALDVDAVGLRARLNGLGPEVPLAPGMRRPGDDAFYDRWNGGEPAPRPTNAPEVLPRPGEQDELEPARGIFCNGNAVRCDDNRCPVCYPPLPRKPFRTDPPPAVLTTGLTPKQHAQVQRYADLLRAGPLDREALGREARAAHPGASGYLDHVWRDMPERFREDWRCVGEHLYRLGQAFGDSRLRESAREVNTEMGRSEWSMGERLKAKLDHLFAVFAEGPEPPPSAPAPAVDTLGGHAERLLDAARALKRFVLGNFEGPTAKARATVDDAIVAAVNAIERDRGSVPPADTWTPAEREALAKIREVDPFARAIAFGVLVDLLRLEPRLRRNVASFVAGLVSAP